MLRRKPSNASEKEQGQKKKLSLQRSSSFKDFMKPKPSSPAVSDKQFVLEENGETAEETKSPVKLSKKWRNVISRTMTRKTSKMVQKTLEEGMESAEEGSMSPMSFDGTPDLRPGQRSSVCSTGSEDTMHSPLQRQISGCGDRNSLDSGYSQRDSMRLEDASPPYMGPFCGRAVVHTDFTPSPYDMETLKLQKGDIIDIIEKPPVGTWTGKLNNKVGSFKFIYVTILPEKATPPRRRKRCHSKNCKPKPKSLEEVLETINLTELSSLLSIHGFESLEDFKELKETHLNELNITEPEQRSKLLGAAELLQDYGSEDENEAGEEESAEAETDEPRDSGCFESSENLENGREEPEVEPESQKDPESSLNSVQEQMQDLKVED